jgi:hypothetical protein
MLTASARNGEHFRLAESGENPVKTRSTPPHSICQTMISQKKYDKW